MTDLLVTIDVGGTLGHADGPSLAARLAQASPLEPATARRIMRHRLHTQPVITDEVVKQVCAALRIPLSAFPRDVDAHPLTLVPGAIEALEAMSRHATLATLSNVTCVEAGTEQLRELLTPWVTDHFPSCRIGHAKPDRAAFEHAAHAFGVTTDQLVHIGDDWECDIVGATSAGATAIWISQGRSVPDTNLLVDTRVLVADDLAAASRHITDIASRRHP